MERERVGGEVLNSAESRCRSGHTTSCEQAQGKIVNQKGNRSSHVEASAGTRFTGLGWGLTKAGRIWMNQQHHRRLSRFVARFNRQLLI